MRRNWRLAAALALLLALCGCALECPWADEVKGILYMGLPEMANGYFLRGIVLMIRG